MRASDVADQDAAALARQHRAEFARIAIENHFAISPDAIFVTDAKDEIREVNPRAAQMFGFERAEMVGMAMEQLVPGGLRQRQPENFSVPARSPQMASAIN